MKISKILDAYCVAVFVNKWNYSEDKHRKEQVRKYLQSGKHSDKELGLACLCHLVNDCLHNETRFETSDQNPEIEKRCIKTELQHTANLLTSGRVISFSLSADEDFVLEDAFDVVVEYFADQFKAGQFDHLYVPVVGMKKGQKGTATSGDGLDDVEFAVTSPTTAQTVEISKR